MDRAAAVELLRRLVTIPSLSGREAEASHWLVERMTAAAYDRAFVDGAGNAVGELGAENAKHTIVLLGHIDTVPGDIPVRIESTAQGDVLYGRGSVDAKGPLATMVAAGATLGTEWARRGGVRLIVVGAVEEESATSKGARFIASRFDGSREPLPDACVIGEPSHWHRITLGYKGRLLLDICARQAMAHTAGPDASIAEIVVDLWNWVTAYAATFNERRIKPFDQLTPTLRRFVTAMTPDMHDTVDAQIAWRLPLGFEVEVFVGEMLAWMTSHLGAQVPSAGTSEARSKEGRASARLPSMPHESVVTVEGPRTTMDFRFRGRERAWRGDRQNDLVRSFLSAIRAIDPAVQPAFVMKTGTSDMNVVGPIWQCPTVAYGPGDSALDHTPHEHLSLDEYWRAIGVLGTMLRNFAQSVEQRKNALASNETSSVEVADER